MSDLHLSRLSSECPQYARRQFIRFDFLVAPFVYREALEKFDFSSFDHRERVEVEYWDILLNTLRMTFATCVWLK